jgi:hypothetical protein
MRVFCTNYIYMIIRTKDTHLYFSQVKKKDVRIYESVVILFSNVLILIILAKLV